VRRALGVDVPSGSEDERFEASDDSDVDPGYKRKVTEEMSSEDDDEDLHEANEPSSMPSASSEGPTPSTHAEKRASTSSEGPVKRTRTEWDWRSEDIPHEPLPANTFTTKGNIYVPVMHKLPVHMQKSRKCTIHVQNNCKKALSCYHGLSMRLSTLLPAARTIVSFMAICAKTYEKRPVFGKGTVSRDFRNCDTFL